MQKKLFLLDAFALVFRAYYALIRNPRITSKGKNTNAQFGFTNTLIDLIKNQQPTHMAVCFDTSAATERHTDFADYKANRQETPEDISLAVPDIKKIIEGYSFGSARHNRYHEGEADSLAVVLLKNANITFNPAFFLRLDSADLVYKTPLKSEIKTYLLDLNFTADDAWLRKGGKGLSNRKYSFTQEEISDSLKTHPDCKKRYEKLLSQSNYTAGQKLTPVPPSLEVLANKTIIWTMFNNGNLTAALYRVFLEKDKGNYDLWHQVMSSYILNGLFLADKKLSRFNAINIKSKEYISSSYLELQNLFEQIPRENLEKSCIALFNQPFWQQAKPDERSFKSILAFLNFSETLNQKELISLRKDFEQSYAESIYREFTEQLK
mgnify:CR=1 FL=1